MLDWNGKDHSMKMRATSRVRDKKLVDNNYSIVMESNLLNGEPYFFSLLKGKFRLEEQTFETNEDQPQEPQPDELTGSFVAVNGVTYGMAKGEDKRSLMLESFNKIAGGSNAPGGDTGEETP